MKKLLLLLIPLFLFMTCNDNNGDDKYDSRNITRIDEHIESVSINAVDSEGKLHVVYQGHKYSDPRAVYYIHQKSNGKWTEPVNISNTENQIMTPHIAIDTKDNIHIVWQEFGTGNGQAYYSTKSQNGNWSQPISIIDEEVSRPQIEIDKYDNIHIAGDGFRGVYRKRENGIWLEKEGMGSTIVNHELAISAEGDVHVAFEAGDIWIGYLYKPKNGEWQERVLLGNPNNDNKRRWFVDTYCDDEGKVYISWNVKYEDKLKFIIKGLDGEWSEIDSIPNVIGDPYVSKIAEKDDVLHFIWASSIEQYDYDIFYQKRNPTGEWSEREQISLTEWPSLDPAISLDANLIHITWTELLEKSIRGNHDIYYETIEIK